MSSGSKDTVTYVKDVISGFYLEYENNINESNNSVQEEVHRFVENILIHQEKEIVLNAELEQFYSSPQNKYILESVLNEIRNTIKDIHLLAISGKTELLAKVQEEREKTINQGFFYLSANLQPVYNATSENGSPSSSLGSFSTQYRASSRERRNALAFTTSGFMDNLGKPGQNVQDETQNIEAELNTTLEELGRLKNVNTNGDKIYELIKSANDLISKLPEAAKLKYSKELEQITLRGSSSIGKDEQQETNIKAQWPTISRDPSSLNRNATPQPNTPIFAVPQSNGTHKITRAPKASLHRTDEYQNTPQQPQGNRNAMQDLNAMQQRLPEPNALRQSHGRNTRSVGNANQPKALDQIMENYAETIKLKDIPEFLKLIEQARINNNSANKAEIDEAEEWAKGFYRNFNDQEYDLTTLITKGKEEYGDNILFNPLGITPKDDIPNLNTHLEKLQGGGKPPIDIIKDYHKLLQKVLHTPNILRLASYDAGEFKTLNLSIYYRNKSGNSQLLPNLLKDALIHLFYIDITNIEKDLPQDFTASIVADTANHNTATGTATISNKYINIQVFIGLLNHIIKESGRNARLGVLAERITHYITFMYLIGFIKAWVLIAEAIQDEMNVALTEPLETKIQEKYNNVMLNYLRIRSDNDLLYNKRFNVKINKDETKLLLKYNDTHDFPYYQMIGDTYHPASELINKATEYEHYFNINTNASSFDVLNYDQSYMFGPFTKIFTPNKENKDIKVTEILKHINDNRDVFIMGYGASGAGKTSSLIYLKKYTKSGIISTDGILIELCKQIIAQKGEDNIAKVEVKCYEFLRKPKEQMITTRDVISVQDQKLVFNKELALDNKYDHKNTYIDRTSSDTTEFAKGSPLGNVLIHLIDTDRYVKATTNNPNSSRSHVVVSLKFVGAKEEDSVSVVVGDFAGVENEFDCNDDINILEPLTNMKIKDENGIEVRFYNKYKHGITEKDEEDSQDKESCKDKLKLNKSLYIIGKSNPNLLDAAEDIKNGLKKYFENTDEAYKTIEKMIMAFVDPQKIDKSSIDRTFKDKHEAFKKQTLIIQFIKYVFENKDIYDILARLAECIGIETNIFKPYYKAYSLREGKKEKGVKTYTRIIDTTVDNDFRKVNINKPAQKQPHYLQKTGNDKDYTDLITFWTNLALDFSKVNDLRKRNFREDKIMRYMATSFIEHSTKIFNKYYENLNAITSAIHNGTLGNDQLQKYMKHMIYTTTLNDATTFLKQYDNDKDFSEFIFGDSISVKDFLDKVREYIRTNPILKSIFGITLDDQEVHDINFFGTLIKKIKSLDEKKQIINKIQYDDDFEKLLLLIYDKTRENLDEYHCRVNLEAKEICKFRRNEGFMINETLEHMRGVIKENIMERAKSSICLVPPFDNNCLPYYCNTGMCFPKGKSGRKASSVIYDTIKKLIGGDERAKNLMICTFLVFNISPMANNPPPVPYIDINDLKMAYYAYNNDVSDTTLAKMKEQVEKVINKINGPLKDKTVTISNTTSYKQVSDRIKDLNNPKRTMSDFTVNLDEVIKYIQKNNAASAVGTLEFVDSLAKYYTTDTVCMIKPDDALNIEDKFSDIRLFGHSKGGSRKRVLKRR